MRRRTRPRSPDADRQRRPPEHIARFMAMCQGEGREVYGSPYRGSAGTYL